MSGAATHLVAAGLPDEDARRDAALLARFVLGWDAARWLTHQREPAPGGFQEAFDALIDRRAAREPVAYITGEREFYGRAFQVTPAVLIPRPETEFLIEEALGLTRRHGDADVASAHCVIDIGTGSGCIAVTLALEIPGARIVATDTSHAALEVARENARRHGVLDRIGFRHGSFLAGFPELVDLVVTNPPYVPERDRAALSPDVAGFEPGTSLFGGPDGLDVIRALVPAAAASLAPGGSLVMEIGFGQAEEVRLIVERAGLTGLHFVPDLQGIPRVAVAHHPFTHSPMS